MATSSVCESVPYVFQFFHFCRFRPISSIWSDTLETLWLSRYGLCLVHLTCHAWRHLCCLICTAFTVQSTGLVVLIWLSCAVLPVLDRVLWWSLVLYPALESKGKAFPAPNLGTYWSRRWDNRQTWTNSFRGLFRSLFMCWMAVDRLINSNYHCRSCYIWSSWSQPSTPVISRQCHRSCNASGKCSNWPHHTVCRNCSFWSLLSLFVLLFCDSPSYYLCTMPQNLMSCTVTCGLLG